MPLTNVHKEFQNKPWWSLLGFLEVQLLLIKNSEVLTTSKQRWIHVDNKTSFIFGVSFHQKEHLMFNINIQNFE